MNDQDAETPQSRFALRGGNSFEAEHPLQALDGAATAADASSPGIGNHQAPAHLRQFPPLAACTNLHLIGCRLLLIGGGNDKVVPQASILLNGTR